MTLFAILAFVLGLIYLGFEYPDKMKPLLTKTGAFAGYAVMFIAIAHFARTASESATRQASDLWAKAAPYAADFWAQNIALALPSLEATMICGGAIFVALSLFIFISIPMESLLSAAPPSTITIRPCLGVPFPQTDTESPKRVPGTPASG